MSSYTSWYKDGTASITNGATALTGSDTYWKTAGIHPGDMLTFDDGNSFAEIAAVNSDTSITLAKPFTGGTKSGATYAIVRNFTAETLPEVASQVIDALGKYTRYFNEDVATLTGKSAYEVAVENGYTGTAAQWLESLKAAGEWSNLNDRTNILTYHNQFTHSSFARYKNLGNAVTAEQLANIRNYTFKDMYVADYWVINVGGHTFVAYIAGINLFVGIVTPGVGGILKPHLVILLFPRDLPRLNYNINDTDTCTGHFLNSKMYTEHFPEMQQMIENAFGAENLIALYDEVADSIDANGNINHRTGGLHKIFLPSFYNLTGHEHNFNRMSFYYANSVKFPLFNYASVNEMNMPFCTISDSYSANMWGRIHPNGPVLSYVQPSATMSIMPFFLLG